ncbi:MAG: universal stress protein, partial [Marinirhabdus sp.]|nr:universal stress protein [Marinirhabdus sp.]
MKKILIPTDFSENAFVALHYVTQLFAATPCEFTIVHSFEKQVTNLTSRIDIGKTEAVVEDLYVATENKCEEVKERIIAAQHNENHTFKTIATSLSLTRAVNKLIIKEEIDFVCMGSKGRTAAEDILLGSNTLGMIRSIKNAALLVVPKDMVYRKLENIAFATGLKRSFSQNELQPLLFLSESNAASIKIIHVQKSERKTEQQRENFNTLLHILKPGKP